MKRNRLTVVPYRRKKAGKTNYKKRLKLLLSQKTRLVVRKSSKNILAQLVNYNADGDHVIVAATSHELAKIGWPFSRKNLPASYLTGLLLGQKARSKKIKEAILDVGLHTSVKGNRVYALVKGVLDAGLNVPHNESILPSQERISGQHIVQYLNQASGQQFAQYKKQNQKLDNTFNELKQKIMKAEQ